MDTKTKTFEDGIKISFIAAKRDIYALKEHVNKQTAYINKQNELIRKLSTNQKYLLTKIVTLEKKVEEKSFEIHPPVERIIEKRIVMASPKKAPVTRKKASKKITQKKTVKKAVRKPAKKVYVGSENRKKLHNPVCPYAKNIKPKNKVSFASKVKPLNQGYRECDCLKKF